MAYPHVGNVTPFEDNVTEVLAEDQIHHAIYGTLQVSSLPTPITGSATAGSVDQTLICSSATFISSGVVVGTPIYNGSDQSVAIVKSVTSETTLVTTPLKWGATNDWTSGDTFSIGTVPKMLVTLTQKDELNQSGIYIRNSSNTSWERATDGAFLHINLTANTDLSAGVADKAIYHCIPSGGTITVTVPDAAVGNDGVSCYFTIHGTGTVIVKTVSSQLIEGLSEQTMTNGAFQLVSLGDHYLILQDSRLKVQSSSITTYSLSEDSTVSDGVGGYYKQTATSSTEPRYDPVNSTVLNSVTIGTDTYIFGSISDQGIIQGILPEWPANAYLSIARNTGSASFRVYVKYYHRTAAGVETLIGTSSLSNLIDTSTIAQYQVTATLSQTTFSATDSLVRKIFATSSGAPTAKISVEGTINTFSTISAPATTISHNSLAGIQSAANGVTAGHITDAAQSIAGIKTFSSSPIIPTPTTDMQASTKKYVDDNINNKVPTSRTLTINGTSYDLSADRSWTISAGWPSIVAEFATSWTAYDGVVFEKSGRAFTVTSLLISLVTLPIGGNFEVNVKKNGTTILSGNLVITTTGSASNSLYVVQTGDSGKATISTTSFASKDRLTIEIVKGSGNTFLGAGVNIQVIGTIS